MEIAHLVYSPYFIFLLFSNKPITDKMQKNLIFSWKKNTINLNDLIQSV